MLVLLERGVTESVAGDIATSLRMFGLAVHRTDHDGQVRLGAVGEPGGVDWTGVAAWPGVASVAKLPAPFKLVSRAFQPHDVVEFAPPRDHPIMRANVVGGRGLEPLDAVLLGDSHARWELSFALELDLHRDRVADADLTGFDPRDQLILSDIADLVTCGAPPERWLDHVDGKRVARAPQATVAIARIASPDESVRHGIDSKLPGSNWKERDLSCLDSNPRTIAARRGVVHRRHGPPR